MKEYDVIILGGGVAGLSAAIYSSRGGMRTVVVEEMFPGGQMATTNIVENYPGYIEVDGATLAMTMLAQAEKCGASILYDAINKVELADDIKSVSLASGDIITARVIIIAGGASPRKIGVDREEMLSGRGVSYCATCDGAIYKGKTVAIVGGGNTAVEEAIYLSKFARQVYLIHRRDSFRATLAEVDRLDKVKNVTTIMSSEVVRLNGKSRLESIFIKNINAIEQTLAVDGLFVAIGRQPQTKLFEGALELDRQGYIVADAEMATGLAGVFVAGDIRSKTLRQIVTAAADGAIAGNSAISFINHNA